MVRGDKYLGSRQRGVINGSRWLSHPPRCIILSASAVVHKMHFWKRVPPSRATNKVAANKTGLKPSLQINGLIRG